MNIKEVLLKNKNNALFIESKCLNEDLILNYIAKALSDGKKIIQYYFKSLSDSKNIELGFKIRQLCSIYDSLLIVNSRLDIAQIINADGLCLFDGDISISQAKKILHNDIIFAKNINKKDDIIKEDLKQFDYICINQDNKELLNSNLSALKDIKIIKLNRKIL